VARASALEINIFIWADALGLGNTHVATDLISRRSTTHDASTHRVEADEWHG
jgi:hypothetical protein